VALGAVSLIFWALIITVSIKYCLFVMRADNHGAGGILALMPLAGARGFDRRRTLVIMGLFGAALIYGDETITPAIGVERGRGVNVAAPALHPMSCRWRSLSCSETVMALTVRFADIPRVSPSNRLELVPSSKASGT